MFKKNLMITLLLLLPTLCLASASEDGAEIEDKKKTPIFVAESHTPDRPRKTPTFVAESYTPDRPRKTPTFVAESYTPDKKEKTSGGLGMVINNDIEEPLLSQTGGHTRKRSFLSWLCCGCCCK